MEPGRVPNRAPEATRAQNGETLIFYDSTKDLGGFCGPRLSFWSQKWVQNGIRIASSTRTPSGSLLEPSWSALGSSWSRKKVVLIALGPSWGDPGPQKPPNINLAIMEREAGDAENAKHCNRSKSRNQGKRSKIISSAATWQDLEVAHGHSHARCARALGG